MMRFSKLKALGVHLKVRAFNLKGHMIMWDRCLINTSEIKLKDSRLFL